MTKYWLRGQNLVMPSPYRRSAEMFRKLGQEDRQVEEMIVQLGIG